MKPVMKPVVDRLVPLLAMGCWGLVCLQRGALMGLPLLTLGAVALGSQLAPASRSITLVASLFGGAMLVERWLPWPLSFVAASMILAASLRWRPELRPRAPWRAAGHWAPGWVAAFAVATAVGLWGWRLLARPDLSHAQAMLPELPFGLVLAGALAFALVNATFEELLFRGWLQDRLEPLFGISPAILLQAISFGLLHFRGVPSGAVGVLLAGSWALALGVLRRHTSGLVTPIAAHVVADLVIVSLVWT